MKTSPIRWRALPGALLWRLHQVERGSLLGPLLLVLVGVAAVLSAPARTITFATATSITPITSTSDGASGIVVSGGAYEVRCAVTGAVVLYPAVHDGTVWTVYRDRDTCTMDGTGAGSACVFPTRRGAGLWNVFKSGAGSVASCTAAETTMPVGARRRGGGGSGGGTDLVRPAVGALDILAYAGGSNTNEGAAGSLDLTASGGAVSYGGIGPYRSGIWSPGAGGGLASANTTKGQETGALTLWAWMMAPETSGSPYVIPVVGKEYVGGWTAPYVDLYLRLHGDLSCGVGVYLGGGTYSSCTSAAGALTAGEMHLLALVYDPAVGADFYIDGVLDCSDHVNHGAIAYSGGSWIVMAEATPDTPHSLAWVAEWRLHRGALSAGEIMAIYRSWVPA